MTAASQSKQSYNIPIKKKRTRAYRDLPVFEAEKQIREAMA